MNFACTCLIICCLRDTISTAFSGRERGAILTTHYMEEADALCSRVAIMVNGQTMSVHHGIIVNLTNLRLPRAINMS